MVANGVEDASAKCSLVGSLTIGTTFFLSFLVGILSDKIGLRATAVLGACLATLGMGLSAAFGYKQVEVLYFTYGIMFGAGASLVYTPSLTILGHYFKKRMGIVNGIVTAGSSIFTIGLSFVNQHILEHHGLEACLQLLASLTAILIICSFHLLHLQPSKMPRLLRGCLKRWCTSTTGGIRGSSSGRSPFLSPSLDTLSPMSTCLSLQEIFLLTKTKRKMEKKLPLS